MNPNLTKHRNLYNGDCTFLFGKGYLLGEGRYTAQVMHNFIDLLAESGVDTYLCNPNASRAWYPSKAIPHILEGYKRGDREFFRRHFPPPNDTDIPKEKLERIMDEQVPFLNRYVDLAEAGVDWVAEISKACRRRGVSPWVSVRMNDMHGANDLEGSYMNAWPLKDPKLRLRGQSINPRDGLSQYLMGVNYERQEVRDFTFSLIRELVQDYDFEGLELDWLRCPYICEPGASQETIDTLTAWHAEIRALTQAQSKKIGKPYPLGVRIPVRLGLLRSVGLDVKELARRGLIDFVSPSNGWQTTWAVPYDGLRQELGEGVSIYGVIEDAPNWMDAYSPASQARGYRLLTASAPLLRGNAAGKLALGADGIETFNFFCTDEEGIHPTAAKRQALYSELRGLENLDQLRGTPKHYALASVTGHFAFPLFEYGEGVPFILEPDGLQPIQISMCAEPPGHELIIQVVVERKDRLPDIGVSFNGSWPNFAALPTEELLFPTGNYTHHLPEHTAFNYRFKAETTREGWNEILVLNGSHKRANRQEREMNSARVVSVELAVK